MPSVEIRCLMDRDLTATPGWQAGGTAIGDRLQRGLEQLCSRLGLPAVPRLSFVDSERPAAQHVPFVEVEIDGKPCPASLELFRDLHAFLRGRPPAPWRDFRPAKTWLLDWLSDSGAGQAEVVQFLGLLLEEVVQNHAGALLTPPVTKAILRDAQAANDLVGEALGEWPIDQLQAIFSRVVKEGVALNEPEIIASELYEGLKDQASAETVAESLIDALAERKVVVHLAPDLLRRISAMSYSYPLPPFATLRDGLFYELGLYYPDFQFAIDRSLPPAGFRVQINQLYTIPRTGLSAGEYLVDRDAATLEGLSLPGEATVNPASGAEFTLLNSEAAAEGARNAGLTVWNAYEYLVIAVSSELRRRSDRIITVSRVEKLLDNLAHRFPDLVQAVRETFSTARLSALLRRLVGEEISVRNLRLLLEAALEADYVVIDTHTYIVLDDRFALEQAPPGGSMLTEHIAEYVRGQMKDYITHKYSGGQNTLYCLLIQPEMEADIRDLREGVVAQPAEIHWRILKAIADDYWLYAPQHSRLSILTNNAVRGYLGELIREAFPRLPVLSYQELSPELSIKPLARIAII